MNALQGFGKLLIGASVLISGFQIVRGIDELISGQKGEGALDVGEGASNLALTVGSYLGVKSKVIVVAEGTGTATFIATVAAGLSLALGFEESRRALRGEKTMIAEASDFWKQEQDDLLNGEDRTVGGAFKYVGATFAKGVTGFLASGQKDLWGLLAD